jgi:hypothetical protein
MIFPTLKHSKEFAVNQRLSALQQDLEFCVGNHTQIEQVILVEKMIRRKYFATLLVKLRGNVLDAPRGTPRRSHGGHQSR